MPICPLRHSQKSRQSRFNVSIKYQLLVILYIYIFPFLLVKVIQCLPHFFWWWLVSWLLLAIFSIAAAWDIQQTLFLRADRSPCWLRKETPWWAGAESRGCAYIHTIQHNTSYSLWEWVIRYPISMYLKFFFWLQKWHPLLLMCPSDISQFNFRMG